MLVAAWVRAGRFARSRRPAETESRPRRHDQDYAAARKAIVAKRGKRRSRGCEKQRCATPTTPTCRLPRYRAPQPDAVRRRFRHYKRGSSWSPATRRPRIHRRGVPHGGDARTPRNTSRRFVRLPSAVRGARRPGESFASIAAEDQAIWTCQDFPGPTTNQGVGVRISRGTPLHQGLPFGRPLFCFSCSIVFETHSGTRSTWPKRNF